MTYAARRTWNWIGGWDNNTLTPGFAYSKESDYESYGVSMNDRWISPEEHHAAAGRLAQLATRSEKNGNPFPQALAKDPPNSSSGFPKC